MMRMMKRAAVGILAAAMALSMLTACGGASAGPSTSGSTSTGGSGNPGSSSSSSASSSNSNGSSSSSSSSTKDDTTKLPDDTEITYQNSKTRQYNLAHSNAKAWYMKREIVRDGKSYISEQVSSGNKYYSKSTLDGKITSMSLSDGTSSYSLYPSLKIAIKYVSSSTSSGSTESERFLLSSMKKTTRVENGTPYYTEVSTYKGEKSGKTMVYMYCFDNTGKLAYTIFNEGTEDESKIHILSYGTSIPSDAILEIPSDWEVYTSTYDETAGRSTVTAPDGHTLSDQETSDLWRKIANR